MLKFSILFCSVLLILGTVGFVLSHQDQALSTSGLAPDFTVSTFDGVSLSLADYRGQVVVLNFWASWCGPCRAEAALLEELHQQYAGRNVVFIGISHAEDNINDARTFIEEFGITYPNAADNQEKVTKAYHIMGVPQTFVIDQQGYITDGGYFPAPITQAETLTSVINRLLQESST